MIIEASFVKSAAAASDLPRDGLAEIALVGRSNVGKSSLINALVRRRIARTSAAPGKTRLANVYRVARSAGEPFYIVDLPGYGYARGGAESARGFDELTRAFFGRERQERRDRQEGMERHPRKYHPALPAYPAHPAHVSALLLVDARHPGLQSDLEAWRWLLSAVDGVAIVATKTDKLTRGERIRALREFESVFDRSVLPVSAVTGEGLDDLWKLIAQRLTSGRSRTRPVRSSPQPRNSREATDQQPLPHQKS